MCERVGHAEDASAQGAGPSTVPAFVDELVVALTNARIYQPEHPRVRTSLESLATSLRTLLGGDDTSSLILGASEDYLFHEGKPLLGASLSSSRLIKALGTLGSGGIRFAYGAAASEFLTLVYVLGRGARGPSRVDDANQILFDRGCRRIHFLNPYSELTPTPRRTDAEAAPWARVHDLDSAFEVEENVRSVAEVYKTGVETLQDVTVRAARGHAFGIDGVQGHVEQMLKSILENGQGLLNVCRYEHYDAFTFGHSMRVSALALHFASRLTTDPEVLQRVGLAAMLHDIGKARVPFEILYARGRLSDEERRIMSTHTEHGGRILLEMADCDPAAVAVAFGHHDPYITDTYGSPQQSLVTRLTKICDVYEALTAARPYKDRMSPIRAYRIMLRMGGQFDRALLRKFIEVNGVYPVGSRVELTDGRAGRVQSQTRVLTRPVVQLESAPFCPTDESLDLSRLRGPDAVHVEQLLSETVASAL